MLEAIKLVGAIVGLATGAFTVWDRWARGRPLAWATAKKLGVNPYKYIRIKNPGPADVFILAVRAYPPKVYAIAKDHSTEAIVDAASFNVDVNVVWRQGEERDLPIVKVSKPDQRNTADQPVRFVIYWRKTSSSWLRQVPVVIWTRPATSNALPMLLRQTLSNNTSFVSRRERQSEERAMKIILGVGGVLCMILAWVATNLHDNGPAP